MTEQQQRSEWRGFGWALLIVTVLFAIVATIVYGNPQAFRLAVVGTLINATASAVSFYLGNGRAEQ